MYNAGYSRKNNYYSRNKRTYNARRRTRSERNKQLVDGNDGQPKFMKILKAGAPYAAAIPAIAKTVSGIVTAINTEQKWHDVAVDGASFYKANPYFAVLSGITGGIDYTQRTGRSIRDQNLTVRWATQMNDDILCETIRVCIVCDKFLEPGLGETPAQIMSKIFVDPTNPLSPINREYSDRFVILKEKLYSVDHGQGIKYSGKAFLQLGIHTKFDGLNANDTAENTIYFIVLTDNTETTLPGDVDLYSRLNYTDN